MVIAAVLTAASLGLGFWVRTEFGSAIIVYIALVHFYSMMGKHIVILDTMLVAAGFVIRAVGGALAIQVPSSAWFVLCTFFAALFLALSKRRAELMALSDEAEEVRTVLGEYTEATLNAYTSTAIAATTLSYALYVLDSARAFPLLPLTVPFVLFAVFRYHHLVETAGFGEKPEDVFLRDRSFQIGVIAFGAAALAAVYVGA
jgi:4-hydroxybenzoate polyprenyltransferase